VVSLALFIGRVAAAEGPTQTERDVARSIAQTGAGYFDNGDWERAREHFHRAYDLLKAPTLALMEARALVKLGHLVEATEAYLRATIVGPDETSEPFRKAAADARAENAALQRRVPSIRVTLGEGDSPTEVRLDGQVVPNQSLGTAMGLNPGTHVIAVTRNGYADSWESVTVQEGEERTLAIEPPPVAQTLPPSRSPPRPFMWTALATGGAGLVVGIVTGALAVDRKAKLDEMCTGNACPPAAEAALGSYRNYKTVSTVGYLVGLVGVATGGVLWAVAPRPAPRSTQVGVFVSSTETSLVVAGGF